MRKLKSNLIPALSVALMATVIAVGCGREEKTETTGSSSPSSSSSASSKHALAPIGPSAVQKADGSYALSDANVMPKGTVIKTDDGKEYKVEGTSSPENGSTAILWGIQGNPVPYSDVNQSARTFKVVSRPLASTVTSQ